MYYCITTYSGTTHGDNVTFPISDVYTLSSDSGYKSEDWKVQLYSLSITLLIYNISL